MITMYALLMFLGVTGGIQTVDVYGSADNCEKARDYLANWITNYNTNFACLPVKRSVIKKETNK